MGKHLTKIERYQIQEKLSNFISIAEISKQLNVHETTIYREKNRGWNVTGYSAYQASIDADVKKHAKRKPFAKFTDEVKKYIAEHLANWSVEQISGRMKRDLRTSISHETIYQYIYADKRDGGKLYKHLRHKGKRYRYSRLTVNKPNIKNRVDISERPKVVDSKLRYGDWEGDTVVGKRNGSKSCLLTLVERKSKLVIIRKLNSKHAIEVEHKFDDVYLTSILPFRTLTLDNGTEFANHEKMAENTNCKIYFARPYCSYERGLNENTNGLARKYFPKGTDFDTITEAEVAKVQELLNNRPRKCLGYLTPNEVMNKHLRRIQRE